MDIGLWYAVGTWATFIVVLWKRYYRLAKYFTIFLGISAVQSVVTLYVPVADRWGNTHIWLPVEVLLMAATVAGVSEALWLRTSQMNRFPRFCLLFGIVVGTIGTVMYFESGSRSPASDWYARLLWDRTWILLGLAIAGFWGFWFAVLREHNMHWAVRLHLGVFSILMAAHALFLDWSYWTDMNLNYRMVALTCYGAWAISAFQMDRALLDSGPLQPEESGPPSLPGGHQSPFPIRAWPSSARLQSHDVPLSR